MDSVIPVILLSVMVVLLLVRNSRMLKSMQEFMGATSNLLKQIQANTTALEAQAKYFQQETERLRVQLEAQSKVTQQWMDVYDQERKNNKEIREVLCQKHG